MWPLKEEIQPQKAGGAGRGRLGLVYKVVFQLLPQCRWGGKGSSESKIQLSWSLLSLSQRHLLYPFTHSRVTCLKPVHVCGTTSLKEQRVLGYTFSWNDDYHPCLSKPHLSHGFWVSFSSLEWQFQLLAPGEIFGKRWLVVYLCLVLRSPFCHDHQLIFLRLRTVTTLQHQSASSN